MMNLSKSPKVGIVVVNYNTEKDTLECLESVFKITYNNFKVYLVDNGSDVNILRAVKEKFPEVEGIRSEKNLGFAGGNNLGIKKAIEQDAEYILLLNSDTLVNPNFLDILMKNVLEKPEYSVFSPQIRLYPEKNRLWYGGGSMIWPIASVHMFNRNDLARDASLTKPSEVTFITGAAMLVKVDLFQKIGLLPEKYFLYFEETDWEARALRRGEKFLYVPDSVIWHKVAKSSGGDMNPTTQYYFARNNLLFAKRNLPIYFWPTFLIFLISRYLILEPVLALVDFLMGNKKRSEGLEKIILGIEDFFKGKFGPKKFD